MTNDLTIKSGYMAVEPLFEGQDPWFCMKRFGLAKWNYYIRQIVYFVSLGDKTLLWKMI